MDSGNIIETGITKNFLSFQNHPYSRALVQASPFINIFKDLWGINEIETFRDINGCGIIEEIWSPPLGGSMMFSFKLVVDNEVNFYELGHIRELNESLVFELKHFAGDLKGWEEKDEVQSFKLVKVDGDRLYFEGFTFEKISENEINIYGLINNGEKAEEVRFNYKKQ